MKILLSILLLSISLSSFAQDSLKLVGDDKVQGDALKSISKYEKRLKKHTDDQDAYFKLAVSYFKAADIKNAIATWDKLIAINAAYPGALANRGVCKYYIKNTDGTCEDFVRSVETGLDYDIMKDKKMSDYIKAHCQ